MKKKYNILDFSDKKIINDIQKLDILLVFHNHSGPIIPSHNYLEKFKDNIKNQANKHNFKGLSDTYLEIISDINKNKIKVLIIGTGELKNSKAIEDLACKSIRKAIGLKYINIALFTYTGSSNIEEDQNLIVRGSLWGTYKYQFRNDKPDKTILTLNFISTSKDKKLIELGIIQGKSLCNIADLTNSPGNIATPLEISSYANKLSLESTLEIETFEKKDLEEKKCGGILSVASGSSFDPSIVVLKHLPKKDIKPIILIGKTITFDSGGISLKASKDMGWMKYDKCGGMSVLCIMEIISKMNIDIPIIGILGIAENMPGLNASRPGDIITSYNKKTIEVLNTDAEGRLVLADAIGIACDYNPRYIIDIATLTGAVITALGHSASAILGNDNNLITSLIKSGNTVGEKLWELPILPDYTEDMKSDFADLSNLSKSGTAGTATAAAFLQEFVPKNIPWAHLDIAGTAWKKSKTDYQDPGATLFSVRLILDWINNL